MKTIAFQTVFLSVLLFAASGCDKFGGGDPEEGWALVPVVVFNQDLERGAVLDYEMVAKMDMPERFVSPSVVKPKEFEKVIGQKLALPVSRGDLVLWQFFASAGSFEHLSGTVKPGLRAVGLPVSGAFMLSGYVRPGDHVDILHTRTDSRTKQLRTTTLLQNVFVLASGNMTATTNPTTMDPSTLDTSSVTVLVLPQEAEMIAIASQSGKLHLTLRNPEDTRRVSAPSGTTLEDLSDQEKAKALEEKRKNTTQ